MSILAKLSKQERVEEAVREFFRLYPNETASICLEGHCDFLGADAGFLGTLRKEEDRFILKYGCICSFEEGGYDEAELDYGLAVKYQLKYIIRQGEEVMWFNSDAVKRDWNN